MMTGTTRDVCPSVIIDHSAPGLPQPWYIWQAASAIQSSSLFAFTQDKVTKFHGIGIAYSSQYQRGFRGARFAWK
jgi:hypothetical protein